MPQTLEQDLLTACPSLRRQEPLSRHTSFGIGGPADYYADVTTLVELKALRQVVTCHQVPTFFLGAGSNLLVSDLGIRGLVLHLQGDFRKVDFDGPRAHVAAGVWMPTLVKQAAERGLGGIESLIGIPGTIGGGLVMNAGTREGVLGDVVETVEVLDGQGNLEKYSRDALGFGYRHSKAQGWWIVGATLLLRPEERSSIISKVEALLQYRARTQPLATSNCGSVFKNPPNEAAARLIEQAGLKGFALGGARVSDRHANFIVNEKEATAADVRALIHVIQKRVKEKFAIDLEPEVKLVGDWPTTLS